MMSVENQQSIVEKLPYDGEFFLSGKRQYQECVVFVHHYGGNKKNLRRHVDMVNHMGFDAVAFNLQMPYKLKQGQLPFSASMEFGLKHIWCDQITDVLNRISQMKIIYSFSNPCSSAIEAIAKRNAHDIRALICDGGPSGKFFFSVLNYLNSTSQRSLPMRLLIAGSVSLTWSFNYNEAIHNDLDAFPRHFPILSIRGWKDDIIPPFHIDRIFGPHHQLDWRKMGLPDAGHLDGLKRFPDEYVPQVQRFMESIATKEL